MTQDADMKLMQQISFCTCTNYLLMCQLQRFLAPIKCEGRKDDCVFLELKKRLC